MVFLLGPVALAQALPMLTAPAVQLASSSCHQHQCVELQVQPDCPGAELCGQAI